MAEETMQRPRVVAAEAVMRPLRLGARAYTHAVNVQAILLAMVFAGVAAGYLWMAVAPRASYRIDGESASLVVFETKAFIGADATFLLIAIGFGTLSGFFAWGYTRESGPLSVLALALGGGAASSLAMFLGEHRTRDGFGDIARTAAQGDIVTGPLDLRATGVLVGWSIAALIAFLVLSWREPGDDAYDDEVSSG